MVKCKGNSILEPLAGAGSDSTPLKKDKLFSSLLFKSSESINHRLTDRTAKAPQHHHTWAGHPVVGHRLSLFACVLEGGEEERKGKGSTDRHTYVCI